jgi:hypothetical protein
MANIPCGGQHSSLTGQMVSQSPAATGCWNSISTNFSLVAAPMSSSELFFRRDRPARSSAFNTLAQRLLQAVPINYGRHERRVLRWIRLFK